MRKWLASIWNEIISFSSSNFWNTEEFDMHIFGLFLNQENCLHSCNFSHVTYFQMLEIQVLPPFLFRTDFPGYRGLQDVHDVLAFWVISYFFKCQKPHYSRHGLPLNSHANFTYSFPTLKIILIPTTTISNRFWFISLIAHRILPMPETQFLYVT